MISTHRALALCNLYFAIQHICSSLDQRVGPYVSQPCEFAHQAHRRSVVWPVRSSSVLRICQLRWLSCLSLHRATWQTAALQPAELRPSVEENLAVLSVCERVYARLFCSRVLLRFYRHLIDLDQAAQNLGSGPRRCTHSSRRDLACGMFRLSYRFSRANCVSFVMTKLVTVAVLGSRQSALSLVCAADVHGRKLQQQQPDVISNLLAQWQAAALAGNQALVNSLTQQLAAAGGQSAVTQAVAQAYSAAQSGGGGNTQVSTT